MQLILHPSEPDKVIIYTTSPKVATALAKEQFRSQKTANIRFIKDDTMSSSCWKITVTTETDGSRQSFRITDPAMVESLLQEAVETQMSEFDVEREEGGNFKITFCKQPMCADCGEKPALIDGRFCETCQAAAWAIQELAEKDDQPDDDQQGGEEGETAQLDDNNQEGTTIPTTFNK